MEAPASSPTPAKSAACAADADVRALGRERPGRELVGYRMPLGPALIGHCVELYHAGDVRISPDAKRKHMAMFGTTGAGKSTLMRNMVPERIVIYAILELPVLLCG